MCVFVCVCAFCAFCQWGNPAVSQAPQRRHRHVLGPAPRVSRAAHPKLLTPVARREPTPGARVPTGEEAEAIGQHSCSGDDLHHERLGPAESSRAVGYELPAPLLGAPLPHLAAGGLITEAARPAAPLTHKGQPGAVCPSSQPHLLHELQNHHERQQILEEQASGAHVALDVGNAVVDVP